MQKKLTVVVALALLDREGQVLLQRCPPGHRHAELWEFPGGKTEPGESLRAALVREAAEELGLALAESNLCPVGSASDLAAGIELSLFQCRVWCGTPQPLVATELGWFAPLALAGLAMPPLDVALAKALSGGESPLPTTGTPPMGRLPTRP